MIFKIQFSVYQLFSRHKFTHTYCKKLLLNLFQVNQTNRSYNSFTHFLFEIKNRNYQFFKEMSAGLYKYLKTTKPAQDVVTRLLNQRNKAHNKARKATNVNRREKTVFHNTAIDTM